MKDATQGKEHVLSNEGLHSEEGNRLEKKKKNREETAVPTSAENFISDCDEEQVFTEQVLTETKGQHRSPSKDISSELKEKEMLQGFL